MSRILLVLLFWIVFAALACTKHESAKLADSRLSSAAPRNLELKSLNDRCLDLQSLVAQFNDPMLRLSGMIHTRKFEILSGVDEPAASLLLGRSFRFRSAPQGLRLMELRGLQQADCETVLVPDPIGKPVKYHISKFSKEHLVLERVAESLSEASSDLPPAMASGFRKFPGVKKYEIWMNSQAGVTNRMDLMTEYSTVPADCPGAQSYEVREELSYRWADPDDVSIPLDTKYFERLKSLAHQPFERASNANEVSLSRNEASEFQRLTQAAQNVACP